MLHNCQIWGHTFTCGISSNLLLSSFCPEFTFSDHFRGPCLLLSYGPHSARSLVLFNLCTYPARIWGEMGEYTNCRKKAWFSPFLQQQTPYQSHHGFPDTCLVVVFFGILMSGMEMISDSKS